MKRPAGTLREGYTTGSAVSAAAVAAFRQCADPVELLLPGDKKLVIPVKSQSGAGAVVVKDGGDDPDVTTGMELIVEVTPYEQESEPADYEENAD